jgi:hypothetical protein
LNSCLHRPGSDFAALTRILEQRRSCLPIPTFFKWKSVRDKKTWDEDPREKKLPVQGCISIVALDWRFDIFGAIRWHKEKR